MANAGPAIEVKDLRKSFGNTTVLDGIDFTVAQGAVFSLLGPNGAGKTTVINILTTLLCSDGGIAMVNGFDVAKHEAEVRESISLTGQFAAVDYLLTGRENLVLIGELRHVTNPARTAEALLGQFGLAEAADRRTSTYSGGMRRKLDIALGLIGDPAILSGHAVSSLLSNLFSVFLVVLVGLLVGFRSHASVVEWLMFVALTALFTLATTWLAIMFGLLAKTVEGAGSFSYILLLLVFVSPGFTPTESMSAPVRAFAERQPITPIVDTMRSLLIYGHAGDSAWAAFAWCGGLLAVCYVASLWFFRARRAPMVVSQ
jgi:ABC-type polar amino acid transport system ATPase subunit